jgi:hypothetical protein
MAFDSAGFACSFCILISTIRTQGSLAPEESGRSLLPAGLGIDFLRDSLFLFWYLDRCAAIALSYDFLNSRLK